MAVTMSEREMVEIYDHCGRREAGHCRDCQVQAPAINEIRRRLSDAK